MVLLKNYSFILCTVFVYYWSRGNCIQCIWPHWPWPRIVKRNVHIGNDSVNHGVDFQIRSDRLNWLIINTPGSMNSSVDAGTVENGTITNLGWSQRNWAYHISYSIYGWWSVNAFLIPLFVYEYKFIGLVKYIISTGFTPVKIAIKDRIRICLRKVKYKKWNTVKYSGYYILKKNI